eukprot:g8332.t1 g8332   contig29:273089-273589(-)
MSSSYQTPDSKKEDFRRYLEKSGAIDSLTSVLVGLYEESDRPLESTEYIKKFLGGVDASSSSSNSKHLGGSHNTNNSRNNSGVGQQQQQQQEE